MKFLALTWLALGLTSSALAATVQLTAVNDGTLYENSSGGVANGAGEHFFVGRTNQGSNSIRRGLLRFDLSTIPAGSIITAVTLTLNETREIGPARTISLFRATTGWSTGASNAAGNEGGGTAAIAGEATWTSNGAGPWTTPGGDFAEFASASTSVGGLGSFTWSGAGLIADAQAWVDNGATNFGWILRGDETTGGTARRFSTLESATAANRPTLSVTFVPEPGSALLALTAAGLVRRRRRGPSAS